MKLGFSPSGLTDYRRPDRLCRGGADRAGDAGDRWYRHADRRHIRHVSTGQSARMTDRATKFGALFDSVMDRVSEAVVLLGLLWFYLDDGEQLGAVLVYVSIVGSTLVSYVRARAEGTGDRV